MLKKIVYSVLLAGEITMMADMGWSFVTKPMPRMAFFGLFALLLIAFLFSKISLKGLRRTFIVLLCVCVAIPGIILGELAFYGRLTAYRQADEGKAELFSNREVMVFAPHEDDELSMLSGTLSEYVRYGSNVRIVFVTNGDYLDQGLIRLREALDAAEFVGIPEENIIFLGYGDGWNFDGDLHIYNAPSDLVVHSNAYRTATYGLPEHPAWREGREYSRQNMYEDIRDVIDYYRPDTIFSMAYEPHADHRATSLFVQEALAEILARGDGYAPLLLESVSYHTSYFGAEDFYNENSLSAQNPFDTDYNQDVNIYNWSDRVRLPVEPGSLSRALWANPVYKALGLHATQGCNLRAISIISGDTVFWQRESSGISYTATFEASSGNAEFLNNFKMLDSSHINSYALPFEDLWLPEENDSEKTVTVKFPQAVDLSEIRLYDNPSLEDNVLEAKISFDDGTSLMTGPLRSNGAATSIAVEKKQLSSFTVQLLETEGQQAGLTEIEAYNEKSASDIDFVKIQNAQGDFVYDYYVDRSGVEYFEIYAAGDAPDELKDYSITYSSKSNAYAEYENGKILVSCPAGSSCTVTVSSADGRFSDAVVFSNPGVYKRSIGQMIESYVLDSFYYSVRVNNCFSMAREMYRAIRY